MPSPVGSPHTPGLDPGTVHGAVRDMGASSPVTIMALLRRRLRDMDQQIESVTAHIKGSTSRAREITEKLQALEAIQKAINDSDNDKIKWNPKSVFDGKGNPNAQAVYYEDGLHETWHVAKLAGLEDELQPNGNKVKNKSVDDLISTYQHELKKINSGNELRMIKLQSAMEQRSEAVSLATNMLKKLHQADEAIVRNFV